MPSQFPIVALMALLLIGCRPEGLDVPQLGLLERLPRTIGGVAMEYNQTGGADLGIQIPNAIPLRVADALGVPREGVVYITGYRDARSSYNSDIYQVPGASTAQLLDTFLANSPYTGDRRLDQIGGKSVVRAVPPGGSGSLDDAPYFYAFEDVVVVIVGDRQLVEEGLRGLP